jgi:hypothetical protein
MEQRRIEQKTRGKRQWPLIVIGVLAIMALSGWLLWRCAPRFGIAENSDTYMTESQIESIRNIGQWEFLSVSAEEIVDTTRWGIFTDDHLVRIYYGTLRLGVDMTQATCESRKADDGSELPVMVLTVPDICLLDSNFIDEAMTRSFHETGVWTASDRNDLYRRAQQKMMDRALSPTNIANARQMAETQLLQLLRALGFEQSEVRFGK